MTNFSERSNEAYALGWSVDIEHGNARIVFRKKLGCSDSACFIYKESDLVDHLNGQCLTNLEYLEGQEFFNQSELKEINKNA